MQVHAVYICIRISSDPEDSKFFVSSKKKVRKFKINSFKKARKIIVTSSSNYDIYRSSLLWKSIKKSGYKLVGQQVFDFNKKSSDDKLEILFENIFRILNTNDLMVI